MGDLQDVTFPLAMGDEGTGRLARPSGPANGAGLLVLHEILGLNEDIDRIATRLADAGYTALAPDFFGGGFRTLCVMRAISELRRPEKAREGGAFDILASAQRFLATCDGVDRGRIGAVGFCIGGGFALLHAARTEVAAVGTFYGDVPEDAESLRGLPPVVGGYGERDRIFGPGVKRLRAHLAQLDVPFDVRIYPTAGHSYMSPHEGWVARLGALGPMNVGYDEAAAEDSWGRMLAFFAKYLS